MSIINKKHIENGIVKVMGWKNNVIFDAAFIEQSIDIFHE